MGVLRPPYETPQTDLPLASATLPGGKSAKNVFLLRRSEVGFVFPSIILLRKNTPRGVHATAADCHQGEESP